MIPKEIDGVPITKPCTPHDRGYIKGWQARQGEIDKLKEERLIKVIHHEKILKGYSTIVVPAWDEYIYGQALTKE